MSTQFPSNSPQLLVGVQVKTADYPVVLADHANLLVMNSASAHTFTLLATPPSRNGWFVYFQNIGAGVCTIARNGNNIDGAAANLTLPQNAGVFVASDGTTYYTERGLSLTTFDASAIVSGQVALARGGTGVDLSASGGATKVLVQDAGHVISAIDLTAGYIPNIAESQVTNLTSDLALKAPLASPALTGTPTAPTASAGDNSTKIATTAYVDTAQGLDEKIANKDAASGYAGLDSTTHLKVAEQQETVDARTSTSEAVLNANRGQLVTFSNTSAVAATIAQAGASGLFTAGWWADVLNLNTGTVTLTPATSTVNGKTTLVLEAYEGGRIVSDGTNYAFITGSVTQDTPNDSDILTFETATKKWRAKGIGTLGGANASQLRGNNISSGTPTNQQVLKWSTADNQYDLVLDDGAEHGDSFWWTDSAFVVMRDEFIRISSGTSQLTGTQNTDIGELGWTALGTGGTSQNTLRFQGGVPPNIGQFSWSNTATSGQFIALVLNDLNGTTTYHQNSFALFEQAGWKMTWVFKLDNEIAESTSTVKNLFQKKSMYVGLMGAAITTAGQASANIARPDIFFGVRFDTSTIPAGMTVTSVAAGTGVYTGTFTAGGTNAFAGQNITFTGFANAANNGTFACTASSTTTVTVSNASSVVESVAPAGSAWAVLASIPSTGTTGAASGGNTVYNVASVTGLNANQMQGLTFVVTGGVASSGANNGTFTCVANTTTTITLNNASGVAETHAIFLTGGNLNDTVMVLEAVQNMTFATGSGTPVRHNIQGTTVSGPAPDTNWHRLDIYSTTAGQIVIQLDGSNTYKLTYTVSSMTFATNGSGLIETTGKQLSIGNTVGYTNARNCGIYPFAAGSVITLGGLTGGPASLNGAYTVEAEISAGPPYLVVPSTATAGQLIQQATQTVAGLPAVTPVAIFGNDDTAAPYLTTRFFADFFALGWNKAIASPSTVPVATSPRYW